MHILREVCYDASCSDLGVDRTRPKTGDDTVNVIERVIRVTSIARQTHFDGTTSTTRAYECEVLYTTQVVHEIDALLIVTHAFDRFRA